MTVIPAPIYIGINPSRNPEKQNLDAPVSSTGQAPQVRHDMPTESKEVFDALRYAVSPLRFFN
jgi:hypothetical protein